MKFPCTVLATSLLITAIGVSGAAAGQTLMKPAPVAKPIVKPIAGAVRGAVTLPRVSLTFCAGKADGPYCDAVVAVLHQCVEGKDSPQDCPSGCDAKVQKCVAAPTTSQGTGQR